MTDKADELLKLARQRFGKLTRAEEKLFKAVANSQFADYRTGDKKKDDPAQGDKWGELRTLRADRIAWLCTDDHAFRFVGHKGIQIIGAKIEGELDLLFTRLAFPITFFSCRVLEPMDFRNGKVGGLFCDGSHIAGLAADGLSAKGDINMRNGFSAEGEVRLLGAYIGGSLDCSKGRFQNPEGVALNADGLKVEGDVNLRDGFHAKGEVRLLGASIGSNLDFSDGRFINPKGNALNLEGAVINGDVLLVADPGKEDKVAKPSIRGRIDLIHASIKGILILSHLGKTTETILDLRHASTSVLADKSANWEALGDLFLDGFTYERIDGLQPCDAKSRIEWIKRSQPGRFTPQPYEQLAKVFRENGFEEDARDVLIAKNKSYIKNAPVSRRAKLRRRIFGWILGYGYRPWKAVWWLLVFWGIGTGLFWLGRCVEVIQPTRSELYPEFIAPVYSLDIFIPLINLHQATYWLPDAQNLWGILLWIYLCVHVLLGWILMTMFIFGLTGLLKR